MKRQIILCILMTFAFYISGQVRSGTYVPHLELPSLPVVPDNSTLIKAMEMRQAQDERNDQIKKEKAQKSIAQVKAYYASVTTFPPYIPNGWHMVFSTNNYDFCDERKVYVENGKVTKYIIDDWVERKVAFSTIITDAKGLIQYVFPDGSKGDMLDIYFLDNINNSSTYTAPPVGSGKISFWSDSKRAVNIEIYIEGTYIGLLSSYFNKVTPYCDQNGTVTFEYKPGTYNYYAINNKSTWTGTVTIYANQCQLVGLTK